MWLYDRNSKGPDSSRRTVFNGFNISRDVVACDPSRDLVNCDPARGKTISRCSLPERLDQGGSDRERLAAGQWEPSRADERRRT